MSSGKRFEPFGSAPEEKSLLTPDFLPNAENSEYVPKDFLYIALAIFLIQGMGVLFPWNAFISAPDYFISTFGEDIMTWFGVFYSIPNLLSLIFMTFVGKYIPLVVATVPSYIIMFFSLIATPIAMYTPLMSISPAGVLFTLSMVLICGFMTASVQSGVFGFGAMMPGKYMTAIMSGNGIAGLLVALLRALTKLVFETGDFSGEDLTRRQRLSITVFFVVASIVLIVCIITYFILVLLPVTRYYLNRANQKSLPRVDSDESDLDRIIRESTGAMYDESVESITIPEDHKNASVLKVFSKIWKDALELCFTFAITLCIFPGLCLSFPTQYPHTFMVRGWLPIFTVIQFNFWDTIGRTLPILSTRLNNVVMKVMDIPLLARFGFLIIYCVGILFPKSFLGNDIFLLSIMVFVAFTNGYFSSLLMGRAPTRVEFHEGRLAGTMMTFFLVGGIVLGTNSSAILMKILVPIREKYL